MKRLCFIVGLALLTLGASLPPAQVAQFFASVEATAASCTLWVAQEIDDDFESTSRKGQFLRITNTVYVCQVDVKLSTGGVAQDRWFGFWSGATGDLGGTNTQYGQWVTNSVNFPDAAPDWVSYTYSPPVELTVDSWLCDGTVLNLRWRASSTNTYEDTTYYEVRGNTVNNINQDYCFRIHLQ